MAVQFGLGCVTFGREIDERTSYELMDHALVKGIYMFDTAAAYGGGASEIVIGRWLNEMSLAKNKVKIATKILPPYTHEQILLAVDASLKRLKCNQIDILYLHRWDENLNNAQPWTVLNRLVEQGIVRYLGASNFNEQQLQTAVKHLSKAGGKLDYIQNNHNLAVSDLTPAVQSFCNGHHINMVGYSPLGAGFLTGKHLNGVQENSRFAIMPAHQHVYFNEHAHQRLNKLMEVSTRTGHSPALLAMAWAVHQPVHTVLIGGRTKAHIDLAFEAMGLNNEGVFGELESV